MASLKIEWKRSTKKDLRKIPSSHIRTILDAVAALADDPFPGGSRKLRGSDHTYRVRIGNFRVVYEVFPDRKVIEIQKIRDRKDIYRK